MTEQAWLLGSICFALSQLLLGLALLGTLRPLTQQQHFYGVFLVAVGAYLLDPLLDGALIDFVLASLTGLVPGMFFLFSASLFDDDFRLQRWHFVAVGMTALPPVLGRLLHSVSVTALDPVLMTVPQLLEFPLLVLALVVAVRHWSPDLVPERRQLRLWFSGFTGLYVLTLILLRETLLRGNPTLSALQFVPACGVIFATNFFLLRYRRSVWGGEAVAVGVVRQHLPGVDENAADLHGDLPEEASVSKSIDAHRGDLEVVRRLMEDEQVYREMGLTLADLARRGDIPVYRLREAINAGLGYRNFNDFVNSYRIREAAARLADAGQRETQILVIAMDAGFRSLSTFNKAFRAAFDSTPTEYRQKTLTDSLNRL